MSFIDATLAPVSTTSLRRGPTLQTAGGRPWFQKLHIRMALVACPLEVSAFPKLPFLANQLRKMSSYSQLGEEYGQTS